MHHDWYDLATLVVLILTALATAFAGLASVAVGAVAAFIAYRASRDARAATDREAARIDLSERRNFANLATAYLRTIPNIWEAVGEGQTPADNRQQFIELAELSAAMSPPNGSARMVLSRIREFEGFAMAQPYDQEHSLIVARAHTEVRIGITSWVADPEPWVLAENARRTSTSDGNSAI